MLEGQAATFHNFRHSFTVLLNRFPPD